MADAERILLWGAMTKDDVLRRLPCAEVLDKQAPTKRDLVILDKEALEYESKYTREIEDMEK